MQEVSKLIGVIIIVIFIIFVIFIIERRQLTNKTLLWIIRLSIIGFGLYAIRYYVRNFENNFYNEQDILDKERPTQTPHECIELLDKVSSDNQPLQPSEIKTCIIWCKVLENINKNGGYIDEQYGINVKF